MFARLMVIVIVLAASGAEAQTPENYLDGITSINLQIENRVQDGCWPRPTDTKREVEEELVRSKVSVDALSQVLMVLYAVGLESKIGTSGSGSCHAAIQLQVADCGEFKSSFGKSQKVHCVIIWSIMAVVAGPKSESQTLINRYLVELARKFLNDLKMDRLGKKLK